MTFIEGEQNFLIQKAQNEVAQDNEQQTLPDVPNRQSMENRSRRQKIKILAQSNIYLDHAKLNDKKISIH